MKEKLSMLNGNSKVFIEGFPDPLENNFDFQKNCQLKYSYQEIMNYLSTIEDIKRKNSYQFSVTYKDDKGIWHLLYTYWGYGKIDIENEYKNIFNFDN